MIICIEINRGVSVFFFFDRLSVNDYLFWRFADNRHKPTSKKKWFLDSMDLKLCNSTKTLLWKYDPKIILSHHTWVRENRHYLTIIKFHFSLKFSIKRRKNDCKKPEITFQNAKKWTICKICRNCIRTHTGFITFYKNKHPDLWPI